MMHRNPMWFHWFLAVAADFHPFDRRTCVLFEQARGLGSRAHPARTPCEGRSYPGRVSWTAGAARARTKPCVRVAGNRIRSFCSLGACVADGLLDARFRFPKPLFASRSTTGNPPGAGDRGGASRYRATDRRSLPPLPSPPALTRRFELCATSSQATVRHARP